MSTQKKGAVLAAPQGKEVVLWVTSILAGCGNKPATRLISFFESVKHGFGGRCEAFGAAV